MGQGKWFRAWSGEVAERFRSGSGGGSDGARQQGYLLVRILFGVVSLCAIVSIVYPAIAKAKVNKSNSFFVVSTRPKAEDAFYILAAQANHELGYVRGGTEFAKQLAADFDQEQDAPIRFYEGEGKVVVEALEPEEGRQMFVGLLNAINHSKKFPYPLAYLTLGLVVGLVFSISYTYFSAIYFVAATTAAAKFMTACPTCPSPTIVGIDAAMLGFAVFIALAGVALLKPTKINSIGQATVLAGALIWQMGSWYQYQLTCLPCIVIGLICAFQLASLSQLTPGLPFERSRSLAGLAVASVVFGFSGYLYVANNRPSGEQQQRPLAAFSLQQKKKLTHIEELGMEATGSERTILIGASRCNPCSNLLKYLNGSQLADKSEISLEFYSYDSEKPDLIQTWQPVPDNTNVPGTPTILRVEPNGSISGIITGFSDDPVWLTKLEKLIMREKQNE